MFWCLHKYQLKRICLSLLLGGMKGEEMETDGMQSLKYLATNLSVSKSNTPFISVLQDGSLASLLCVAPSCWQWSR